MCSTVGKALDPKFQRKKLPVRMINWLLVMHVTEGLLPVHCYCLMPSRYFYCLLAGAVIEFELLFLLCGSC